MMSSSAKTLVASGIICCFGGITGVLGIGFNDLSNMSLSHGIPVVLVGL